MNDSDHRKKMISLRLTAVELEVLKTKYRSYGARNVSDLARLALQRLIDGSVVQPGDVAAKLADLNDRVNTLESEVSLLLQRKKVMS